MTPKRLWNVTPNGKPREKGGILSASDIRLWGWSAALLGWCTSGGQATPEEVERASKGLAYLAKRMAESVSMVSPERSEVRWK